MRIASEIWLLEDDIDCATITMGILSKHFKAIQHFSEIPTLQARLSDSTQDQPAFLIADMHVGSGNFLEVVRSQELVVPPNCPWILMTGFGHPKLEDAAAQAGAALCLSKSFEEWELVGHIRRTVQSRRNARRAHLIRSTPEDSVESRIAGYILSNQNAIFMREELLNQGWPGSGKTSSRNLLDNVLSRLRPKFEEHRYRLQNKETELGNGWQLVDLEPGPTVK